MTILISFDGKSDLIEDTKELYSEGWMKLYRDYLLMIKVLDKNENYWPDS